MRAITSGMSQWKAQRCSGRNLMPPIPVTTVSVYGVTMQLDADGVITLNGTATQNIYQNFKIPQFRYPAGAFTHVRNNAVGNGGNVVLAWLNPSVAQVASVTQNIANKIGNVASADMDIGYIRVTIVSGIALDNYQMRPSVEMTNAETAYEPYCGGSPERIEATNCKSGYFSVLPDYGLRVMGRTEQDGVPTPDSPVQIRCVKAGTKVRCCGKNLFDIGTIGDWEMHNSDLNLSIGEDYAEGLVLNYAMGSAMSTKKIGLRCGDICTASWQTTGEAGVLIRLYDKDGNILTSGACMLNGQAYVYNTYYKSFYTASKSPETFIITDPSTAYVTIGIVVRADAGKYLLTRQRISRIQLERGSVATDYEPYVGNEITVPCDLYEGDVWYPMTGVVERNNIRITVDDVERIYVWNEKTNTLGCSAFISGSHIMGSFRNETFIAGDAVCNIFEEGNSVYLYPDGNYRFYVSPVSNPPYIGVRLPITEDATPQKAREYLTSRNAEFVVKRKEPIIERYPPQSIWAPSGTVNILQTPDDLAAKIETTLMIRR